MSARRTAIATVGVAARSPAARIAASWRELAVPVLLLVAVGTGLAIRLRELGERSLWVDELFSVGVAAQDLSTLLEVLNGEEANMTLYYLVMWLWVQLVGPAADEAWMRLPSVLFGAAGLWAIYVLGRRLDGPATGLIAAILLALNGYHAEMSEEARAYALWALLATLSWDALVESLDTGDWRVWRAYVIWTTLAIYAHFFTAFVILAQVVVVALRGRPAEWRALVASGVGVALLCLPFAEFFLVNSEGSQISHVRPSDWDDPLALLALFAGAWRPLLVAYGALAVLGTIVAVRRSGRAGGRPAAVRAAAPLLWLLVPVLTVFALSSVTPMFKERYLFASMPAFALLAALGLAAIRPLLLRVAGVLVMAALSAVPISHGLEVRQGENWRGAVAHLEAHARPDDGMIFISKRGQLGYEYYAGWLAGGRPGAVRPDILEPFDWHDLATTEGAYRAIRSGTRRLPDFAARHPRIWLVLSHEYDSTFDGDTSEAIRAWLSRNGYAARQRGFQNIRVLLYERRA